MKDIVTKGQDLRKLSWTRTFFLPDGSEALFGYKGIENTIRY